MNQMYLKIIILHQPKKNNFALVEHFLITIKFYYLNLNKSYLINYSVILVTTINILQ